jgi:hypothetical protein
MKKIPIELQIIFKILGYCILGILLGMILVYILGTSKGTPQEKEWHFRDSVNKAWVYKHDSIK